MYNESDPRFGQPDDPQTGSGTTSGPTDWVPDGQGSWMPPQSSWPAGMVWDPKMANFSPATQSPAPAPTPGPTTGGGGGLPSPFSSPFTAPPPVNLGGPAGIPYIPPTPVFTPPGYRQAPAFQAPAPFQAPSMQEALNDPGYQFPLTQGLGAVSNGRAAQGLWATGATGKAFNDYAQNYANQFYGNIYNRDLNTYQQNYKNSIDAYNVNYGTQYQDPNTYDYQAAKDTFAPQLLGYQTQAAAGQHQTDMSYANAYSQWLNEFDQKYKTAGFLRDTEAL